jgi:hypothetical protein
MPSVEMTSYKPTYRDEFAPAGKISCTLTYSASSALMSTNGIDHQKADAKHDMGATVHASDGSRLFKGERTSHIYVEATSNTRHWASRDTTSSGTRINNTLSHDACSSRPLLSLSPLFAAWI